MPVVNGFTKYAAALEYVSRNISSALAVDLQARLAGMVDDISELMQSEAIIGARFFYNGEARRTAISALLLCQRAYLAQLRNVVGRNEAKWPNVSVDYWNQKSENAIKDGIWMYTTQPGLPRLSVVAAQKPDDSVTMDEVVFKLSRKMLPFPVHTTCYRAVQSWLLQAGHVSLPWYLQNVIEGREKDEPGIARNNGVELLEMFGRGGHPIDVSTDAAIPSIPRDCVVYMYKANKDLTPASFGALGHWMVSRGTGFGYGRNNSQSAADKPLNSWACCSIDKQIQEIRPKGDAAKAHGLRTCIVIYQPIDIGAAPG